MKHIFILNPVAGKGKAESEVLPKIMEAVKEAGIDYEIHRTMNVRDGFNYVKNRCMSNNSDEIIRFYAVGGDGTLNEVTNGAFGYKNVEIAFIPAGTGNDFARGFTNPKFFLDIKRQLAGTPKNIDIIKYNDKYSINMLNIGLDCAVAVEAALLKKKPLIKGPLAYAAGIGVVLTANQGFDFTVTMEGGQVHQGPFTLVAIGNGAFCGGGFKSMPLAKLDDGLLDVSLVRKINRRTLVSLLMLYRKGTHLESPKIKEIITYIQCRSLTVKPVETMQFCVDGEVETTDELSISIIPEAINFSVPEGCE